MKTRDLHVEAIRPLLAPAILLEELPLDEHGSRVVARGRLEVKRILDFEDDRLLVVAGPCSIHDPVAALEYARRLRGVGEELSRDLLVVMRVYFEKPRTTVGWKGLINDPHLDGSCDIAACSQTYTSFRAIAIAPFCSFCRSVQNASARVFMNRCGSFAFRELLNAFTR